MLAYLMAGALVMSCSIFDPDCPDSVVLQIDAQNPPVFNWQPACPADDLQVDRTSDHASMWVASGPLRPPIRYGDPKDGRSEIPAAQLEPGVEYRVAVNAEGRRVARNIGLASFTLK